MSKTITRVATMGWREWIDFPELGVVGVKAKIDTGARSSALHAEDLEFFKSRSGKHKVRFVVYPVQRSKEHPVVCVAKVHDERWIRSSNGRREMRPVVRTTVGWAGFVWEIDLTLTARDMMGFRMLLGREAVRKRYLIDPGRSYLGRPKKRKAPSAAR